MEWKPSAMWFAAMTEVTSAQSPVILMDRDATHVLAWGPCGSRLWRRSAHVKRVATAVGNRPRWVALARLNVAMIMEASSESGIVTKQRCRAKSQADESLRDYHLMNASFAGETGMTNFPSR